MIERFDPDIHSENPVYQAFASDHRNRYVRAGQLISEDFKDKNPIIIDAACGCGYGYDVLHKQGQYLGLDCSRETITAAQAARPEAKFKVGNIEANALWRKLHPQVVVSFETAEHLRCPERFLNAIRSAILQNGRLIFSVPTCLTRDYDSFHKRDWSASKWYRVLRQAGFNVHRIESTPFEAKFSDLYHMLPLTKLQISRVIAFDFLHPWYAVNRAWKWFACNKFEWTSAMYYCS